MNMRRCNYFIPLVIMQKLQAKARESGTPMSEHVRAALAAYLKAE